MKKLEGNIKLGYIGLGGRGEGLLSMVLACFKDIEVVAVCDLYEDRMNKGAKMVKSKRGNEPFKTKDYKEIIAREDVNCVMIATAWEDHIKIAIESMNAGKFTAMEVGGAYKLQDCYDLVEAYEKTGSHCMMMENCCYGEEELMVLNMVRQGLFGTIVHCEGGYMHDLRYEISHGDENRHYRLRNYMARNCENYPTHELGPIAKVLDINRGNRIVSLYTMASKSCGLAEYIKDNKKVSEDVKKATFNQGDIVVTSLKCENGETIVLTLDTTLPRTYSRNFTVRGTKGMYREENGMVAIDGKIPSYCDFNSRPMWGNKKKYKKKYNHVMWLKDGKRVARLGHGGMDYFVFAAMFDSCKNGTYPPIDVYDIATWMAVTPLSEQSIVSGKELPFPDFTKGAYKTNREKNVGFFALDK